MTANQVQKYKGKSIPQLIRIATKYFNAYIRRRDISDGCISCTEGKVENAGHFLSAGHHSAFRFHEKNVHGQCVKCNLYLSGNLLNYRKGLVKKIGLEKVEWLESQTNKPFKWDRFSLIDIIEKYR